MSSPAEAYAERQAEERNAEDKRRLEAQYECLRGIVSKIGFGDPVRGNTYGERQIAFHLHAAYELISLELRARRKDPAP